MAKYRILVVDDEEGMLEVCGDILRKLSETDVVLEQDSRRAADRIRKESWDLLIADIRMPGLSGVDLLRLAQEYDPGAESLIITAFPSVDTAVESMKLGASDYITKPFIPDDLLETVRRLLQAKRLRDENTLLQRQVERPYFFGEMIGKSAAMQAIFDTIRRVADTEADVLIMGETGTGKELVARSIHKNSPRRDSRFVPVDCGAIPEDLLESEFFGHERGAFTGASSRSLGLLEFASGGTFFLDEIGELPLRLQAKLLRALQERRIRRIGGKTEIEVDIRVVAATARQIEKEIEENRFREDLYYRINVVRIALPPLRDRIEDIPLLVNHFIRLHEKKMGREGVEVDNEVLEVLSGYAWPGNVREVQNVVKRMLAVSSHDILQVDDLPDEVVSTAESQAEGSRPGFFDVREQRVASFEQQYLRNMMSLYQGDVTKAASEAQLPRGTLYRLLKKHDISPSEFRD